MRTRLKAIYTERGQIMTQLRGLVESAKTAGRDFNADEQRTYDTMCATDDRLKAEADRLEGLLRREDEVARGADLSRTPSGGLPVGLEPGGMGPDSEDGADAAIVEHIAQYRKTGMFSEAFEKSNPRADRKYRRAYGQWLGRGQSLGRYQAALQADSDVAGGYLITPLQMTADLIKKLDDDVFIRRLATVRQVTNAQSLGTPSLEADPADADWTSEIATGNEDSSMSFGRREWHPHPLAKLIKLSNKLLRFDAAGAESLVRDRLAYKFGLAEEKGFLTGTGASQALGVFTASSLGISTSRDISTGNAATAIAADNLIEVKYGVKGQYQRNGAWIFHRDAIKQIRKLKDTTNQYLWQPGLAAGEPDRILDRPFYMSEWAPNTFTTGLYVGIFGDFRFYWIAESLTLQIQRLVELYAATAQTGFIGRMEVDGMPVLEEAFARVKLA